MTAKPHSTSGTSAVFISGSLSITTLPETVVERLGIILDRQLSVLIGDARGVDRAVQRILCGRNSQSVTVYCSGDVPRNNVGK